MICEVLLIYFLKISPMILCHNSSLTIMTIYHTIILLLNSIKIMNFVKRFKKGVFSNMGKNDSIASLVIGIIAIVLSWIPIVNIAMIISSTIGIFMASSSKKKARMISAPTGIATAGLVLSIIGFCFSVVGFILFTLPTVILLFNYMTFSALR